MISAFGNFKTSSDVLYLVAELLAIKLDTRLKQEHKLLHPEEEIRALQNWWKMCRKAPKRNLFVVLYLGMFLAFWQPWKIREYSFTSDIVIGYQYLLTRNCWVKLNPSEWCSRGTSLVPLLTIDQARWLLGQVVIFYAALHFRQRRSSVIFVLSQPLVRFHLVTHRSVFFRNWPRKVLSIRIPSPPLLKGLRRPRRYLWRFLA